MKIFNRKKIKNIATIFIVDDNELDSKVLVQEFELRTSYQINSFTSGESFLKYLISNPPNKKHPVIIILDYQLNALNIDAKNGIEILKTIKEINRDYEVIMISSHTDVDIVTTALHFEAINFVKKNENVFMRLQNNIKWIISQRELRRKRKEAINTIITFIIVMIIIIAVVITIAYNFPELLDS